MLRLFFISLVLISLQQSGLVNCQWSFDDNSIPVDDDGPAPEDLSTNLDSYFGGDTFLWSSLSSRYISSHGLIGSDPYFVKFNSGINDFLNGRLLTGSLSKLKQITTVTLTFHDINDNIVQDEGGQPLQYTSSPQDLGHLLEFLHKGFDYSYVNLNFHLIPNSNFDPQRLFFHFAQSLPSSVPIWGLTPTTTLKSTTTIILATTSTSKTTPLSTTTAESATTTTEAITATTTTTTTNSPTAATESMTTTTDSTTTIIESSTSLMESTTESTSTTTIEGDEEEGSTDDPSIQEFYGSPP